MGAATIKVQRLREEARAKAEQDAKAPRKWRDLAAEAVREASRPYLVAVAQAQQSEAQWKAKAQQTSTQVKVLQKKARELKADSQAHQLAGEFQKATAEAAEAVQVEAKAQGLASRAHEMLATAAEAATSAKGYYRVATEAAAQAAAGVTLPP